MGADALDEFLAVVHRKDVLLLGVVNVGATGHFDAVELPAGDGLRVNSQQLLVAEGGHVELFAVT